MGTGWHAVLACAFFASVTVAAPTAGARGASGTSPPGAMGGAGAVRGGSRLGGMAGRGGAAFSCGGGVIGPLLPLAGRGRRGGRLPGQEVGGRGPVCALGLRLVNISKTKEKWADTACDDYAGRVKKMGVAMEQVVLKPAPGPPKFTAEQQKEEEGKTLLSRVDTGSEQLIVLDERGTLLTSHELASMLQTMEDDGVRMATFAIGGAHGHSQQVRDSSHKMISLSKMVMNHQIARVVLMEQIYRAYTILKGVPYHK